MTLRLRFELADALLQAEHAAGCTTFIGPYHSERISAGPADPSWVANSHRPAVLLVADTNVYLISNGSPSQLLGRRHVITYPQTYGDPVTSEQVRRAAGLGDGVRLNYPLTATGGWVNLAYQGLLRGFDQLVIDIATNGVTIAVARRRRRATAACAH
jgi:hypothetical protein